MSGRFSPDEALHIIHDVLTFCGKRHPAGHPFDDGTTVLPRGDVETIQNQVRSLRAYLGGQMDAVQEHGKCGCCGVDMAFHVYLDGQVNLHLMTKSLAEQVQRRHHRKGCTVVQARDWPGDTPFWRPVPSTSSALPLTPEAVAALKQEAENAPDTPGIEDWGRKAVLGLIASHEALRESIALDWEFCHIGCPYAAGMLTVGPFEPGSTVMLKVRQ
ncbi:hypothetical protein LCGC14_1350200 [marine sediment metagenome]|uniref:Uncharacterized protein n=1 Tax=marine sediment metagenome TaxID=412755 RepID=A0A0F9MRZ5_9ZZZZ